ncbi:MAG TPA: hypothetical protein VFM30_02530 [Steroidobacteraceae bacterium]|nr:hypothetical protein [Steroidobacteraceae bacterium]
MSAEVVNFREALTDAIRYWEPRRIVYNGVLAFVVAIHAAVAWFGPVPMPPITSDALLSLFLLAVLANVAYCAAYIPDIPAQLSGFRAQWLRLRVVVFVVGLVFASILARFYTRAYFSPDA